MKIADLSIKAELIKYLKSNNLWAKKGLSQNFLVDKDALGKIVEAAELRTSDLVIEVGAGTGVLTRELVKRAGEVVAVELDQELAQLLNCYIVKLFESPSNSAIKSPPLAGSRQNAGQFSNEKFEIINADILKLNLNKVIGSRKYKVVANIPYHITSKILELFLSRNNKPESMVLLVQKEVAERICAKPGDLSILAISVQLYGRSEIIDIVPKESFFPSPKVDSAILKINNIHNPFCHFDIRQRRDEKSHEISRPSTSLRARDDFTDEKEFFRLAHIGFAARRKTLVNNLMAGYCLERNKVIDIIKKMDLEETVRAQELSLKQWKKLAGAIKDVD